jgi:hypothetical protein
MAQGVQLLPSKYKSLSSNPSNVKEKKKRNFCLMLLRTILIIQTVNLLENHCGLYILRGNFFF